jgi:hypothetical protein
MPIATFSSDAILHYSIGGWSAYGLAVPNWSDDTHSQNSAILGLVNSIGRNLQALMCRPDARQRVPPSINTLIEIHKLCLRARFILDSKKVPENKPNLEAEHTLPAPEVFHVYPTPFFEVRNPWLKQWAQLILIALSEAMQHTENAKPLEISTTFANSIGKFIERVYYQMSVELLKIPAATASAPNFELTAEQLATYAPSKWFTSTEMVDTVPDLKNWPTEDMLRELTAGVPVTTLNGLGPWPLSGNVRVAGTARPAAAGVPVGTDNAAAPGSAPTAAEQIADMIQS